MKIIIVLFCIVYANCMSVDEVLLYNNNKNSCFNVKLASGDVLKDVYFIFNYANHNFFYLEEPYLAIERKDLLVFIPKSKIAKITPVNLDGILLKNGDLLRGKITKNKISSTIDLKLFGKVKIKNRNIKLYDDKKPFFNKTFPVDFLVYDDEYEIKIHQKNLASILELKNITDLSIYGKGEKQNYEILKNFKNLKKLKFYYTFIDDLSFLNELSELKHLTLIKNNIKDIPDKINLNKLTSLSIIDNNLTNLDFLKGLKSLENLTLSKCNVVDITPINELKNLCNLNLDNNNIVNFSLKNLKELGTLSANGNRIGDISSLKTMPNLLSLSLNYNNLTKIDDIKGLNMLEDLSLEGNKIKDISPLGKLKSLVILNCSKNKISSLINIKDLELISLDLSSNNIEDLTFLNYPIKLEELILNYNQITDLSKIAKLTNLVYLSARNNKISNIDFMKGNLNLSNLDNLDLSFNPIKNAAFLKDYSNLEFLNLSGTLINDIQPFKKTLDLQVLNTKLSKQNIANFSSSSIALDDINISLENMPSSIEDIHFNFNNKEHLKAIKKHKITSLYFDHFKGDFSFVKNLHDCEILSFDNTNFSDLSLLENQTDKLFYLNLVNCPIKDYSFLEKLHGLTYIEVSLEEEEFYKLSSKFLYKEIVNK